MEEVVYLYLDDIIPNRFQPREIFEEQALKELALSIKEHGVIQPIIVRKVENKYEIIAGERRYKAATMVGLTKIPAIVRNLDDKETSKVALIENLQRKDLTPIEEARTYQKILEIDELTQEELAKTVGKSQSAVANKLRLLTLPDEIQTALLKEKISERHARTLLNVSSPQLQVDLLSQVIETKMPVRDLELEIKKIQESEETGEKIEFTHNTQPEIFDTPKEIIPAAHVENDIIDIDDTEEKLEILDNNEPLPFINIDVEDEIDFKSTDTIQEAIDNIREAIKKIEEKGYKLISDELDLENSYQFIIELDKRG